MSQFLQWRDSWLLGHKEIDAQHIALADLLNEIAESLQGDPNPFRPNENTGALLQRLLDETRQHFADEEEIMRSFVFPDLPSHKREHTMLLAELKDFIRDVNEGRKPLDLGSITSLKHWLIDHVGHTDRDFMQFVKNNYDKL